MKMNKTLRTVLLSMLSTLCLTACLLGVIGCNKPTPPNGPTPQAEISAVKTASHGAQGYTVDLGDEIVYTITITNSGDLEGTANLSDEVPANTTFVSGCDSVDANKLSWTVEVPANSTKEVKYTVKVNNDETLKGKQIVSDKAKLDETELEAQSVYVGRTWGETDISFIKTAIRSYKVQPYFEGADLLRRIFYTAFSQCVSMSVKTGTDPLDSRLSVYHYYTASDMLDLVFEDSTDANAPLYKSMVAPCLFGGVGVGEEDYIDFVGNPVTELGLSNLVGGDVVVIEQTADTADEGSIYIFDGQDLFLITDEITKVNGEEVLASAVEANRFAVLRLSVGLPYVHKAQPRVKDADLNEAQRAVIATAEAFLMRGPRLQYNDVDAPIRSQAIQVHAPEDCTSTEWQYTNCAMFTYDCYYFGLDYSLGGSEPKYSTDRQLYMTGAVRPFYYEINGSETSAKKEEVKSQFLSTLQPGDIVVYRNTAGTSGHSMLYVGNGTIIHSSGSVFQAYSSDSKTGYEQYESSIRYMQVLDLFQGQEGGSRLIFGGKISKIAIIRPLAIRNNNSAPQTSINRLENLQGISVEKVASQSSTVTVNKGGKITYTFNIYNTNDSAKTLNITDVVPANCTFVSGCDNVSGNNLSWTVEVPADTIISLSYTVKVSETIADGSTIVSNEATVGGVPVKCHKIYVGRTLTEQEQELFKNKALELFNSTTTTERDVALINKMYKEALGIDKALPHTQDSAMRAGLFDNACQSKNGTINVDDMGKYIAPTMYYGRRTDTMDGSTTTRVEMWGGDRAVLGRSCHLVIGDILVKVNGSNMHYYLYLGGETFYRVNTSSFGVQVDVDRYFEYVYAAAYHGVVLRPSLAFAN